MSTKTDPESVIRDIKRKTRKKYISEEKIPIVLEGMRGEESIAAIRRRESINQQYAIFAYRHYNIRGGDIDEWS